MRPHIRPAQMGGNPLGQSINLWAAHLGVNPPMPAAIVKL